MTQVDFYILPSADPLARLDFACKLTEKAWRMGHRIYLHCSDGAQRDELDARLWRFKGESFVPTAPPNRNPKAWLYWVWATVAALTTTCWSTWTWKVPPFAKAFARVAEVVVEDPAIRQAARESFRFYREQGYPLQDHRLQRL